GGEELPAPSAQVWAGVSQVLVAGPSALHPTAQTAAIIGAIAGIVLVLLEKLLPARARPYVPSPSGLGLAMVIPGSNSISMFIGAAIAEVMRRKSPQLADRTVLPVASGFIVGESLMGILIMALKTFGLMPR
ncbi:MAG: OPT/YSL family transporter, partial [Actinobacteria bacterium]|nr:OPT/YSL family transporter [Actinomycetota bacterium]